MAWFVSSEYKDSELGTYWSPDVARIESEQERFKALGLTLAQEIEAKYMAGPRDRQRVDYPSFGVFDYPRLEIGWRWPIPDRPFQDQLMRHEDEIIDIVCSFFGWAISQRVIDIIEAIEPGVHQYLPFELLNPDGSVHPAKRWLLNVCTRAECIDTEKSNIRWLAAPTNHWFSDQFKGSHLVVKAEEARKRAVLHEWRFNKSKGPLISDALWNAIQSAGLRGWQSAWGTEHIEEL
jgi:hypothetical protein